MLNQRDLDQIKLYIDKVSWKNGKRKMYEEPDYILKITSEKN